jgi:hypothetical protein
MLRSFNSFLVVTLFLLGGCAAEIEIYEPSDTGDGSLVKTKGVPFRIASLALMTGTYTTHSKLGPNCTQSQFAKVVEGASSEIYYANAVPKFGGVFAKSEFSVELGAGGVLKKISLNTEPALKEGLEGVSKFVTDGLPGLGVDLKPFVATKPACDTGSIKVHVKTIK